MGLVRRDGTFENKLNNLLNKGNIWEFETAVKNMKFGIASMTEREGKVLILHLRFLFSMAIIERLKCQWAANSNTEE